MVRAGQLAVRNSRLKRVYLRCGDAVKLYAKHLARVTIQKAAARRCFVVPGNHPGQRHPAPFVRKDGTALTRAVAPHGTFTEYERVEHVRAVQQEEAPLARILVSRVVIRDCILQYKWPLKTVERKGAPVLRLVAAKHEVLEYVHRVTV